MCGEIGMVSQTVECNEVIEWNAVGYYKNDIFPTASLIMQDKVNPDLSRGT